MYRHLMVPVDDSILSAANVDAAVRLAGRLHARLTFVPRVEVASPPLEVIMLDRASVGATLLYRSSRAADPAGLIVLDEQAELGVDAAVAFAKRVALTARMENALDVQTYDVVGYPLPGRSFHAELEVRW